MARHPSENLLTLVTPFLDGLREGDMEVTNAFLDICEVVRPELLESLSGVVNLDDIRVALARRQVERDQEFGLSLAEALALLKGKGYHAVVADLQGVETDLIERSARSLVRDLAVLGKVHRLPFGWAFGRFCELLSERIMVALLQLVVDWLEEGDGAEQDASRLLRDVLSPGFGDVGFVVVQRLIDQTRLPCSVETHLGPDAVAMVHRASNKPIALRCALLGEEYRDRSVARRESHRGSDSDRREMATA